MKTMAEYLTESVKFKRLAEDEKNPEVRAALEKQAAAYRKLATDRAKNFGNPPPETSSEIN